MHLPYTYMHKQLALFVQKSYLRSILRMTENYERGKTTRTFGTSYAYAE